MEKKVKEKLALDFLLSNHYNRIMDTRSIINFGMPPENSSGTISVIYSKVNATVYDYRSRFPAME